MIWMPCSAPRLNSKILNFSNNHFGHLTSKLTIFFFQVKISPHLLEVKEEKENEAQKEIPQQLGIKDIFKNPDTRKFTLIMWINWIVVTLGYYGISMGASNLGGDVFVSSILISLIEIPSYVFTILLMDHWGRKPMFVRYFTK